MRPKLKTIIAYLALSAIVAAAVAGTLLAVEGPISTDPIQRIHGGAK